MELTWSARFVSQDAHLSAGDLARDDRHSNGHLHGLFHFNNRQRRSPFLISGQYVDVQATGYVISKSKQTDGDYHIMFCDSPGFTSFSRTHCVNAEVVPYLQCNSPPANGTQVTMRGTLRFDGPQDWL